MKKKYTIYILISIICIIYTFVCIIFDGSYVKYGSNAGWQPRKIDPISYWASIIFTPLIPIYTAIYIIKDFKKNN